MKFTDLYENRRLKTQKGSVIKRSKYGVGKDIGGRIYIHRDYIHRMPNVASIKEAKHVLVQAAPQFKWNALSTDMKTGNVTFMEAPDFDTADEPTVGRYITVATDGKAKPGVSKQIWHHKWLWVDDDYRGFDVNQSFERSRKWLALPDVPFNRIGKPEVWQQFIAGKL